MAFTNGKAIHGFGTALFPPNASGDLAFLTAIAGTGAIQVAGGRQGGNCLRLTTSAQINQVIMQFAMNNSVGPTDFSRVVWSFYGRYIVKPVATQAMWSCTASAGSQATFQLNTTSGFWELVVGAGTAVSTGVNPVVNTWYRFDCVYRLDLNPRTFEVRITEDGSSSYLYSGTATGPAEVASSGRWWRMGSQNATTQTIEFCDILGSGANASDGDFPITPLGQHHIVSSYFPTADGAHAVGAGTFRYTDNNGTGFTNITDSTTVSWSRVDEWPPKADADAADDWVDKSAGTTATDRVEWVMGLGTETRTPIGVHAHSCLLTTTTVANNCSLYLREGTTDAGTLINTGTIGSITRVFRGMCFPLAPDGTAWTAAHLNATKIRFSSNDISPVPRVKAVMLEAAFQYDAFIPRPSVVSFQDPAVL